MSAVRRAVGDGVCIRIDANQAWRPREAVRILNEMQEKGLAIEFVEQPVKAQDIDGLRYVTEHSDVPVLADESVFSPEDAMRIMQTRSADLINIKLMKCGGLTNALKIASAAEVYGVECMIGCMLEAKISVNAAVELACAKSIITKVDLDGPVLCSEDPILGGAVFQEKEITVSDEPGLGISGPQIVGRPHRDDQAAVGRHTAVREPGISGIARYQHSVSDQQHSTGPPDSNSRAFACSKRNAGEERAVRSAWGFHRTVIGPNAAYERSRLE